MTSFKHWEAARTLITLLIIVGLIFSVPQILKFMLRTDYPLEVVVSESMIPTLQVGDLIIVQGGFDGSEIKVGVNGDIIIFPRPGTRSELIAHRAIDKSLRSNEYYFRTKGDNNPTPDGWTVYEGDIVGKVIGRVPLIGYVLMFLGTPSGMVIAGFIVVLLILSDLIPFLRDRENRRAQIKV